MTRRADRAMHARPTSARFLIALLFPATAVAEPLTEDAVVRAALHRPAVAARASAEIEVARSESTRERVWPNPFVSFTHEETGNGSAANRADSIWIEQTIEISGRRGLRSDAALRRADAVREDTRAMRLDLEARVRARFSDVLLAQERAAAIADWLAAMERFADAVARRESAGDVSGFDRRRLEREEATARARLEIESAALDASWERLAGTVGGGLTRPADGAVVQPEGPRELPPLESFLSRIEDRPELRALAHEGEAGELERRAGARAWIPELVVGAGYRRENALDGFVLVAGLSLPIFDHGQADSERGDARRRRATALRSIALAETSADVRALYEETRRLSVASARFRTESTELSAALVQTAEVAYAAGEIGILELLDAHRGVLEAKLEAIEMEATARRARVALDRVAGGVR